jgi:hypothetical protein
MNICRFNVNNVIKRRQQSVLFVFFSVMCIRTRSSHGDMSFDVGVFQRVERSNGCLSSTLVSRTLVRSSFIVRHRVTTMCSIEFRLQTLSVSIDASCTARHRIGRARVRTLLEIDSSSGRVRAESISCEQLSVRFSWTFLG